MTDRNDFVIRNSHDRKDRRVHGLVGGAWRREFKERKNLYMGAFVS